VFYCPIDVRLTGDEARTMVHGGIVLASHADANRAKIQPFRSLSHLDVVCLVRFRAHCSSDQRLLVWRIH
jgi:hypothetical protein